MSPRGMLDPAAAKGKNEQGYVHETGSFFSEQIILIKLLIIIRVSR